MDSTAIQHAIEMHDERIEDCIKARDHDISKIRENSRRGLDPVLAEMDIEACRARYVLETYELRRKRWFLMKEAAVLREHGEPTLTGIVRTNVP